MWIYHFNILHMWIYYLNINRKFDTEYELFLPGKHGFFRTSIAIMTNNHSQTECHSQDDTANNYVSSVEKYNHDYIIGPCNYQLSCRKCNTELFFSAIGTLAKGHPNESVHCKCIQWYPTFMLVRVRSIFEFRFDHSNKSTTLTKAMNSSYLLKPF